MTMLDLELEIGRNLGDGYPVLARAGRQVATSRLPVTSVELERQFATLHSAVLASSAPVDPLVAGTEAAGDPQTGDPQTGHRQADDHQHMRELGGRLFDALVTGDVRKLYADLRDQADEQSSTMRLVLRVRPAELARLPWEFLFDPDRRDYLGLSLSLVRYPEVLAPRRPLRMDPPLRILGMLAQPAEGAADRATASGEEQREQLRTALAGLERAGLVELAWVDGYTPADLEQALNQGAWHGLHFIGHGEAAWNEDFSRLLADHHTLRLVVLHTTAPGSGAATQGFAGTAGALVRQGIPAVVAMQFEVTAAAVGQLAQPLYRSVAKGLPVDIGVMRARRAVRLDKKDTLEWGTPVLYLRASDGRVFDAAPAVPAPTPDTDQAEQADPNPEALYDEAMDAFWAGQWEQAGALLDTVLAHCPEHPDAVVRKKQADRELELRTRDAEGRAAAEAGEWAQAIAAFEAVVGADPVDVRVRDRLAEARSRLEAEEEAARAQQERSAAAALPDLPRLARQPKAAQVLHCGREVNAVAFSPDGGRLALAGRKNIAQLWDTTSGQELLSVGSKAWRRTMEDVAFSADGGRLATASDDGTARIWDTTTGEELHSFAHDVQVWGVAFSPDGQWLATVGDDCAARIWDTTSGEELRKLSHDNWVRAVAFSPDGRWLATAGVDRIARIWDTGDGEETVAVEHDSLVTGVAFSPDGGRLATASDDGIARIWDATIGQGIVGFAHEGPVTGVAFSPDGRWLGTAGQDCTARIWDAATGRELATVSHADEVWAVTFSPDGEWLATGSSDRTARIWTLMVR